MSGYGVSGLHVAGALHGVDLDVAAGEIAAVLGGDGAGKSTLLAVIAGRVRPDAGQVRRPNRAGLGYVPTGAGAWPNLSVDENVAFVAAAQGAGPAGRRRAAELLDRMDLGRFGGHLTRSLSGGQHQKLAVVLAMLHQPELLVLDEPTTGVDPVSRAEVWRLLARAAAEGTAVVVATGYLDEGERAHRVHLLSAGRMLLSGSPAQLVSQVDGEIRLVDVPPRPERAWRSGTAWRAWFAPGEPVLGEPVRVTLEDAAIVSMVRAREAAA